MIDINEMRKPMLAMGLPRINEAYTLYYDETNNIRRLHIRSDGLNVKDLKVFVLGGVVHRGDPRELSLAALTTELRLQPSIKEMKFKHLADGDLLDALDTRKIEIFLDWLLAQDLEVHFFALDPLYWSVVDVIDSILAEHREPRLSAAHQNLKNDLYGLLRLNPDHTIDLFQRYDYPDVGAARRPAFVAELLDLLEQHEDAFPHFSYYMLKGTLQIARGLERLPFLEDETPNVLIDRFGMFFLQRLCLFKNARHILDVEPAIRDELARHTLVDAGKPFENFGFAESHEEPGVQISDVVVGLLGRLFTFVVAHDRDALDVIRESLTERQTGNLASLSRLLARSLAETPAFLHFTLSLEDHYKLWRLVDGPNAVS
ncbi:DUF3800 domain-containing protein [Caulobacter sp. FWC2]|uniref:DUF3800 domain-containing protein n=1 Tax=Caulobacter sp. FWC2 TaxID=69664 RepID=UPI000C161B30|nr:DUF3800 domain-containing protein [Caulobacter sp. FWC2]